MDKGPLAAHVDPRQRVRSILGYMERFDNTVQYSWFLEIARTFLDFRGDLDERLDGPGTEVGDVLGSAELRAPAMTFGEVSTQLLERHLAQLAIVAEGTRAG